MLFLWAICFIPLLSDHQRWHNKRLAQNTDWIPPMKIANNVQELIGRTPLLRVQRLNTGKAEVLAKLESMNPLASVKDRIAAAMIDAAEKQGLLQAGAVIIEPTSGNTGIGLASAAAVRGYKLVLCMPETMSIERRKLLKFLGAQLVLTDGTKGMNGAIAKAEELLAKIPGAFMPQQFKNPANVEAHRRTTAEEIWADTDGEIDVFIAGIGTGGTITGVGEVLKQRRPSTQIVAVEPNTSAVISGEKPGPHKIQGLGAGFIPEILNKNIIDEVIKVKDEDAGATARLLAKKEGLLAGISSGAAMWAALELSKRSANAGKRIVALLPDTGERYISTWLFEDE